MLSRVNLSEVKGLQEARWNFHATWLAIFSAIIQFYFSVNWRQKNYLTSEFKFGASDNNSVCDDVFVDAQLLFLSTYSSNKILTRNNELSSSHSFKLFLLSASSTIGFPRINGSILSTNPCEPKLQQTIKMHSLL